MKSNAYNVVDDASSGAEGMDLLDTSELVPSDKFPRVSRLAFPHS